MSMEKQERLVVALETRTYEGKLKWAESAKANTFVVSFASNSIRIKETENNDGMPMYVLEIVNDQGRVVDEFSDESFSGAGSHFSAVSYNKMKNLYESARRVASGAEEVLNSILFEIEDELPF